MRVRPGIKYRSASLDGSSALERGRELLAISIVLESALARGDRSRSYALLLSESQMSCLIALVDRAMSVQVNQCLAAQKECLS